MMGSASKLTQRLRRTGVLAAATVVLGALAPALAQADVIATFDWVSYFSSTGQSPPTTPNGSFSVDLATFNLTGTGTSAYYTSGSAETGTLTALNYTFGDGISIGPANLTSPSIASMVWSTSATATPALAGTAGRYLTAAFNEPGTANGGTFNLASAAGNAGGTTSNSVTLANNGITPTFPPFSSSDSGYWKLDTVVPAPVPLPAAFPMLLGGLGLVGRLLRRRSA